MIYIYLFIYFNLIIGPSVHKGIFKAKMLHRIFPAPFFVGYEQSNVHFRSLHAEDKLCVLSDPGGRVEANLLENKKNSNENFFKLDCIIMNLEKGPFRFGTVDFRHLLEAEGRGWTFYHRLWKRHSYLMVYP